MSSSTIICSYLGTDPEPRPGLSSGHIPHSLTLPFNLFLKTHRVPDSSVQYTTFLSEPELRKVLVGTVGADQAQLVLTGKRSIITSCGSGMTAGVLWLGLKLLGAPNVALYDEVRPDLAHPRLEIHKSVHSRGLDTPAGRRATLRNQHKIVEIINIHSRRCFV